MTTVSQAAGCKGQCAALSCLPSQRGFCWFVVAGTPAAVRSTRFSQEDGIAGVVNVFFGSCQKPLSCSSSQTQLASWRTAYFKNFLSYEANCGSTSPRACILQQAVHSSIRPSSFVCSCMLSDVFATIDVSTTTVWDYGQHVHNS